MDELKKYAGILAGYSCDVKPGENVMVLAEGGEAKPLVIELVKEIYRRGANPFAELVDADIQRELLLGCNAGQMGVFGDYSLEKLKRMHALIVISALDNPYQYADVPLGNMQHYNYNFMQRCFFGYGVSNTKWTYVKYPTRAMAQLFGQSLEEFSKYYYAVCTMDYARMSRLMDRLAALFERTDRVRIVGKGTDISFSIKGIPAQKSDGRNGLPDGEVFTAPVRDSANGTVSFNCPVYFRGTLFENIRLRFENGRVVEASANKTEKLNRILELDEAAKYLGEFAIAVNNRITKPMKDILFDEKIGGSFHFALGNSYPMTDNGNHSAIHMDIVNIQTPEYGGGEIYFDGALIRKDGKFLPAELKELDELV